MVAEGEAGMAAEGQQLGVLHWGPGRLVALTAAATMAAEGEGRIMPGAWQERWVLICMAGLHL